MTDILAQIDHLSSSFTTSPLSQLDADIARSLLRHVKAHVERCLPMKPQPSRLKADLAAEAGHFRSQAINADLAGDHTQAEAIKDDL